MNKMTDKVTKLYIADNGDPSVGIFPCTWVVEVPFVVATSKKEEYNQEAESELANFRYDAIQLYKDYCDGRCTAYYDFERQETDHDQFEENMMGFLGYFKKTDPPKKESETIQQWEHLLDTKI